MAPNTNLECDEVMGWGVVFGCSCVCLQPIERLPSSATSQVRGEMTDDDARSEDWVGNWYCTFVHREYECVGWSSESVPSAVMDQRSAKRDLIQHKAQAAKAMHTAESCNRRTS